MMKFCQENTIHYGSKCSSCESTSDTDTDCDSDYDFIVSDSEL